MRGGNRGIVPASRYKPAIENGEQRVENSIDVETDVSICNAHDAIAELFEFNLASGIGLDFSGLAVRSTVNFNDHVLFAAYEVGEVVANRCLPDKFETTELPVSQPSP